MSSTYIAGYDGSETGRAAVQFVATLARAHDAAGVAVHVAPPVPGLDAPDPVAARTALALEDAVRRSAEHTLDSLRIEGVATRLIRGRSPAPALCDLAAKEQAALIAVGVREHRPSGRLVPGSIGMQLLHGAPCPVVVVSPAGVPRTVGAIGIADDGSEESQTALHVAEGLAERLGARLVPLEQAAGDASLRGVDLVVTGSARHAGERDVWASALSSGLVDRAPCPVLVTPSHVGVELMPADHAGAMPSHPV